MIIGILHGLTDRLAITDRFSSNDITLVEREREREIYLSRGEVYLHYTNYGKFNAMDALATCYSASIQNTLGAPFTLRIASGACSMNAARNMYHTSCTINGARVDRDG